MKNLILEKLFYICENIMMMVGVDVIYYAFTEEIRNYSTKRIQRFLGVAGFKCSPFIRYDIPIFPIR